MPPTRFPYGRALGWVNQFGRAVGPSVAGTAGLFTEGDTTPDVTVGSLFYTNNTSSTIITHFDLQSYANRAVDYEGKIVTVFFLDNSTRLANAVNMYLQGTNDLVNRDVTSIHGITLMHSRSGWYEIGRHMTNRNEVATYTIAAQSSINVDDVKVAIVANTGAGSIFLSAFSGGQVGQILTLMPNTSGLSLFVQTGGNIYIQGTNAYLMSASGAYQFVKRNSAFWNMITISTLGNA